MESFRLLAVETSGRHGSIAVGLDGALLAERAIAAHEGHARDLLPLIDETVRAQGWRPADIGVICVSVGPGSFTGLRVAVTFARHLAMATGARVCAVESMHALAQNAITLPNAPQRVVTILPARKDQVFAAEYRLADSTYEIARRVCMTPPAEFLTALEGPAVVLGEGAAHYRDAIAGANCTIGDESLWHPRAAVVLSLGWRLAEAGRFTSPTQLVPLYVRRPEAEEVWERRQAESENG